jgi:asparagine synthase (glutamine-hydrolysing)
MCGITGYRVVRGDAEPWLSDLPHAVQALRHRGPDDEGLWFGAENRVGLGHRRLSILDLTASGHQPMVSACGQWIMVFNGEVYNFREIRALLEPLGHHFAGTGDSEVILAAFAQWGPDAVSRFIGMFAIALWHRPTRALHLIRDRLGVKPLFYRWDGRALCFGSELKALRAFGGWHPQVDAEAVDDFLRYQYINDPRAIYRQVFKLPPAHRAVLDQHGQLRLQRYWNVLDHVGWRRGRDEAELAEELEALMVDAFRYRMIADVPVGMFLSGGIDSSLVSAILQKHAGQRLKTFTIGFDDPQYDESPYAAAVAKHLGTEHHCRRLKVADAKPVLGRWGELYDEPFADASGVATFMVSRVAAEEVKVVLSADGGDELFSGYESYAAMLSQWRWIKDVPQRLRVARPPDRRLFRRALRRRGRATGGAGVIQNGQIRRAHQRARRGRAFRPRHGALRRRRARAAHRPRPAHAAARGRIPGTRRREAVPVGPAQLHARRRAGEGRPRDDGRRHRRS